MTTTVDSTATSPPAAAGHDPALWSRERIEELLSSGKFRYQRIDLPHGLATSGEDRRPTADIIFGEPLDGMTVLDLGCNHGFFCFEALDRGAARAVGLEHSKQIVRRARLLGEIKGSAATFEHHDLDASPVNEDFD